MAIKGEDDFPRGGTRTVPKTTTASKHKQENVSTRCKQPIHVCSKPFLTVIFGECGASS